MSERLRSSLDAAALARLAAAQANNLIADGAPLAPDDIAPAVPRALERLEHCFARVDNKYFFDGEAARFSHLHGDQYAMWLYILANELSRQSAPAATCDKLFLLNKALHGCDIFYEVELPSVFLLVHPLATVLGRATYADYLIVYQRVGIGSNRDVYPRLGSGLTLHPGASILGDCNVGAGCTMAAESLLLDRDLAPNMLYIGGPRDCVVRPRAEPAPIWRRS